MPRLLGLILLAACALSPPVLAQRVAPQVATPLMLVRGAETPIQLQQAAIAVDIGGGMAETTIELSFHNPNGRVLEGELQFPLAPGQRVAGFALDFNGEMRPAVPVEKAKGRQVFEQIVRRGVDPALLETTEGNNFKLRVYPIPPRGERRVRVRIAQLLNRADGRWIYTLPLPYALDAQALDASVRVHGAATAPVMPDAMSQVAFEKSTDGYTATLARAALANGALTLTGQVDAGPRAFTGELAGEFAGESGGETYFYAEIPVETKPAPRQLPRVVGLLWDSSGSGAKRRHDLEFALLDHYLRAAGNIEVRLVRLRDRADNPRSFTVKNGDWSQLRRELESTVYDGATALGGWAPQREAGEYLLFSDGLENYGSRAFPTLLPGQRLFAVDAASGSASARLNALAQRAGGRLIRLESGADDAAAGLLLNDFPRIAHLDGDGLAELQAESKEPRDGVLRVAGRRLRPEAVLRIQMAGAGSPIELKVSKDSPRQPLAPLLWAGWRIDALQAEPELKQAEIARLGKRFGIATSGTSLIVLDRLDDYVRYDITPPAPLRKAFEQMQVLRLDERARAKGEHLERVVRELDAKLAWWKAEFPKGAPPPPANAGTKAGGAMQDVRPPPPPFMPPMPAPAPAPAPEPIAAPAPPPAPAAPLA